MGIHKLMSLILEKAKNSVKTITLESLTGRTIACDASTVFFYNKNERLFINF